MPWSPDGIGTETASSEPRRRRRRASARILVVQRELVRRRVIVYGRVQGVWFRGSLSERARAHGVGGWVANRPDGNLEAVLEGPREDVERLIRFCKTGPPRADVQRVQVSEEVPEGVSGFSVR